MVIASRTIHSWVLPRDPRAASPAAAPAHSCEEETEADTLCQKSDVAIGVSETSYNQNVGGYGLTALPGKHTEKETKRDDEEKQSMTMNPLLITV
jgi:hypothetical protein